VVSYVFRLADANGFARPTMLLRAIGEPIAKNIHAGILEHHDITLNAPALARLAAMTGRSTASLGKTLPSLGTACTDRRLSGTTVPLINAFSSAAIRGHCQPCIARIPGHPNIRVDRRLAPAICGRHHRWLDTTREHPDQVDLANNIEIITALRRFQRLPSGQRLPPWPADTRRTRHHSVGASPISTACTASRSHPRSRSTARGATDRSRRDRSPSPPITLRPPPRRIRAIRRMLSPWSPITT
jgi:hypothetical protein